MPHIPRSLSPSGLQVDPTSVPRAPRRAPLKAKPPVPYMGSGDGEVNPISRMRSGNQMIGKLSMKDWDVDPLRVMKHLFNKEVTADEHSGLVS